MVISGFSGKIIAGALIASAILFSLLLVTGENNSETGNDLITSATLKDLQTCTPHLANFTSACDANNVKVVYFVNYTCDPDLNSLVILRNESYSCTCIPNWTCAGYSICNGRIKFCNVASDPNRCYAKTNLNTTLYFGNFSEFAPQACEICIPNWITYSSSCSSKDIITEWHNDSNSCYNKTGSTTYLDQMPSNLTYSCDYCTPYWLCDGYGPYNNNGISYCNASYDVKRCFESTGLDSDKFHGDLAQLGMKSNGTCIPDWKKQEQCNPDDRLMISFSDINGCLNHGMPPGQWALSRPKSYNTSFACDYNSDGFIGNLSSVNNSFGNLSYGRNGLRMTFNDSKGILFEFDFNTYISPFNFGNLFLERNSNQSDFAYLIIRGLDLTAQGKTKTVYFNRVLNTSGVCIKDSEVTSISEVTAGCNAADEVWLVCPGSAKGYNCTLLNNNTLTKITGLTHSAVKEQATYCGDGACNGGESCSSCTGDCGACSSGGSSGGGSGTSHSYSPPVAKNETANITKASLNETENKTGNENKTLPENNTEENQTEEQGSSWITGAAIGAAVKKYAAYEIIVLVLLVLGWAYVRSRNSQQGYATEE